MLRRMNWLPFTLFILALMTIYGIWSKRSYAKPEEKIERVIKRANGLLLELFSDPSGKSDREASAELERYYTPGSSALKKALVVLKDARESEDRVINAQAPFVKISSSPKPRFYEEGQKHCADITVQQIGQWVWELDKSGKAGTFLYKYSKWKCHLCRVGNRWRISGIEPLSAVSVGNR